MIEQAQRSGRATCGARSVRRARSRFYAGVVVATCRAEFAFQRFCVILVDLMSVFEVNLGSVSQLERLAIAKLSQEMDSLGCEITSVRRDPESVGRWQAQWRVKDPHVSSVSYGATGDSALDATRAALSNAQSDLAEPFAHDAVVT